MQQGTQTVMNCPKCGKAISAASEEDARERLRAHDEEMHEGSYQGQCDKRNV